MARGEERGSGRCCGELIDTGERDHDAGKRQGILCPAQVARNPLTPVTVLKLLARDKEYIVRSMVAGNPSTPPAELELLALEPEVNDKTRWPLSSDREKVEAVWTSRSKAAALRATLLRKLLAGPTPSYERVYGLMLEDCPSAALTKCATSSLWLERCAVAQHAGTAKKLLPTLEKDTHAAVSVAASWRLSAHEEVARLAIPPKSPK